MALITTTVTASPRPVAFRGISSRDREFSLYPQGEVLSYVSQTVPATGVGDNQRVSYSLSLPAAQAYSLQEFSVRISPTPGAATNFSENGSLFVQGDDPALGDYIWTQTLITRAGRNSANSTTRQMNLDGRPTTLFRTQGAETVGLGFFITNTTTNDNAYTFEAYARLLAYNLQQSYSAQVQGAIPTRS